MALRGTGTATTGWVGPVGIFTGANVTTAISGWARIPVGTTQSTFFGLSSTYWWQQHAIVLDGYLQADVYDGISFLECGGGVPWTPDGLWHHFYSPQNGLTPGSWTMYLDGVLLPFEFDYPNSSVPVEFDSVAIGYTRDADNGNPPLATDAAVAEVTVWQGGLATAEIRELASGASPLRIGAGGRLRAYFPLRNDLLNYSPSNRIGMRPYGTPGDPVWTDHPPVASMLRESMPFILRAPLNETQATATINVVGGVSPKASALPRAVGTIAGSGTVTSAPVLRARATPQPVGGTATIAATAVKQLAPGQAIAINTGASVSAAAVTRLAATASIAGQGSFTSQAGLHIGVAALQGASSVTATATAVRVATVGVAGVAALAPTVRRITRGLFNAAGHAFIIATPARPNDPAQPSAVSLVGDFLSLAEELPLLLADESTVLFLPLSDRDILTAPLPRDVLLMAAESDVLGLSTDHQGITMALLHAVAIDPVERIFLRIGGTALLSPATENITGATFTPSSQAVLDGHTLVESYFDAPNAALAFKPTGGVPGTQYAWVLSFNTTDVNGRSQTRKRTILVTVVTK